MTKSVHSFNNLTTISTPQFMETPYLPSSSEPKKEQKENITTIKIPISSNDNRENEAGMLQSNGENPKFYG